MIQILCICYNSKECIQRTLKTWKPYVGRFCILINSGLNDDKTQIEDTIKEIKCLGLESLILVRDFHGFSSSRNELITESKSDRFKWSIFIDDSYELVSFKKPDSNFITSNISIDGRCSNRMFKTNSTVKYTGRIHEILDYNSGHFSGIEVHDRKYESHIYRTAIRQKYHLEMLEGDYSERGMYYKACSYLSLFLQGQVSKQTAIEAIKKRIDMKSTNLVHNMRIRQYLKIIENM